MDITINTSVAPSAYATGATPVSTHLKRDASGSRVEAVAVSAYRVNLSSEGIDRSRSRFEAGLESDLRAFERRLTQERGAKERELDSELRQFEQRQSAERTRFENSQRIERMRHAQKTIA